MAKDTKSIDDFTDAELAAMVRNSLYAKGERFGGENGNRFLLVLAVPYGPSENVDTLTEALEGFALLLSDDDWKDREFQVYDHNAAQRFFSASCLEVEGNDL